MMIWFLALLTALRSGTAARSIGAIESIFVAMASLAISDNASLASSRLVQVGVMIFHARYSC